jgi:hypothetical protein
VRKLDTSREHVPAVLQSVFWRDGLTEQQIWDCGRWVEQRPNDGSTLKARGDLGLQSVIDAGLAVEPDTRDHPRHANIIGWPEDKEQRVAKAQKLAFAASLVLLPKTA